MEKQYDFKEAEKKMQDLWKEKDIYRFKDMKGKSVFSIDTPPPTVSGSLHIGHVFSYAQAEMIARYKRMRGYQVFYPFGFDDNGLPTERLVEKEEKIRARDLPASEFRDKCMITSEKYEKEFKEMWESLGFSVDWNLKYRTVELKTQKISQRSFLELVKMKKAYRKDSPVLWCTECQTSIAQAELDTKEMEGIYNYLPFQTEDGTLTVATTRPELLFGCVCLFVHPEDIRFTAFVGKCAKVPLYEFSIPILTDEEVNMEKGTGVVMCATFGDSTDVLWYEKYGLPFKKVILENGRISEEVPCIGSMKVKDAREEIIKLLKEKGLLIRQEETIHTVAVHERCGREVEIIPSGQWYIDVLSEKERFLKAAEEINWYPKHMKTRYDLWVQNLKWDWCISRQRYFGVPIPVWYCKECHSAIFPEYEQLPVNPSESKPQHPCSCGCTEFIPETAVFDTWATSSVTPLINANFGEPEEREDFIPMGMRAQAHEIIRTWAFYTIVKSLYHTNRIPWNDIMISGFVLAKKGEKISKSKNNASNSPAYLIKTHSADILRYWAASSKLGTDTFFSEEELKPVKRFITKLWNAGKFVFSHLIDWNPSEIPDLLPVDLWILERVKETTRNAAKLLDEYEIGQARHEMDDLFWKDFCDYYIEIVKERLYQPEKHGAKERNSARYACYHAFLGILKLYAIYTPHITDYLYQEFFRKYEQEASLHLLMWKVSKEQNDEIHLFGEEIKKVIMEVRKYKSENNLSMKEEMDLVSISCNNELKSYFIQSEKDLMACTNCRRISYI